MRYTLALASLAAGLGVGVGLLIGRQTASNPVPPPPLPEVAEKQTPTQPADPPKKDDTPAVAKKPRVKIPLDTIYTTTRQRGMYRLDENPSGDSQQLLNTLTKRLEGCQVPTTFVMASGTIRGALSETLDVFTKGKVAGYASRTRIETVWVFLYLGWAQDRPDEWVVTDVSQSDSELSITYDRIHFRRSGIDEPVAIPYCYWIPLDERTRPGLFTIRLVYRNMELARFWDKLSDDAKRIQERVSVLEQEMLTVRVYLD
jgi:hypothetical protein